MKDLENIEKANPELYPVGAPAHFNMTYKDVTLSTVGLVTFQSQCMNLSRVVTMPVLCNNTMIRKGKELLVQIEIQQKPARETTESWKAAARQDEKSSKPTAKPKPKTDPKKGVKRMLVQV